MIQRFYRAVIPSRFGAGPWISRDLHGLRYDAPGWRKSSFGALWFTGSSPNPPAGLKALFRLARVDPERIGAGTIGFQIGPRINAPTRLAAEAYSSETVPGPQASLALGLLVTSSVTEADFLADQLEQYNLSRLEQLEAVYQQAEARVVAEGLMNRKLIMLAGADWPTGLVGLVAGRLMQKFGRPTIVLSLQGEEAVGSARSIDGFHLLEALSMSARI